MRNTRRSFLRAGTAAFLLEPLLRTTRAEAEGVADRRLILFMYSNGAPHTWAPSGSGESFTLTAATKSLEPIRRDLVIVRNLEVTWGGTIQNAHEGAGLATLTGTGSYAGATSCAEARGLIGDFTDDGRRAPVVGVADGHTPHGTWRCVTKRRVEVHGVIESSHRITCRLQDDPGGRKPRIRFFFES